MDDPIRVALVDDHPLWRDGVAGLLHADPAFEVVGQGGSASDAARLADECLPDVMLLDVSMPGGGLNTVRTLSDAYPAVKVVMLTVSEDDDTVLTALKHGARGYVLKGVGGAELLDIVCRVHAGETYITPSLAAAILTETQHIVRDESAPSDPLSELNEREHQILSRLSRGLTNRQIAQELSLSEKTVKHYMTNILQKLHVRNRVEAALLAQTVAFSERR